MTNLIRYEKDNKIVYITCDCQSEVLVIQYDPEISMADLCIYESYQSYSSKMSLWQKIKYIIKLMFKGTPYTDQIVLSKKQINHLKDFFNSLN